MGSSPTSPEYVFETTSLVPAPEPSFVRVKLALVIPAIMPSTIASSLESPEISISWSTTLSPVNVPCPVPLTSSNPILTLSTLPPSCPTG